MTPDALFRELDSGTFRPVLCVVGADQYLRDRVIARVTEMAITPALAAFNHDRFVAGENSVESVLGAANLLPMMAERRLVLVRQLERWEGKGDPDGDSSQSPLDRLATYAEAPNPSTLLLLVADALDGRRRFTQLAKKADFFVTCEPMSERELPTFVVAEAKRRGHRIEPEVAALIAQLSGPDAFQLVDAIERLSLYVGPGADIDDDAVAVSITRLRVEDSWALVDALRARDPATALAILGRVYDPRDRGLPLLGAIAWSVRQMLKLQSNLAQGLRLDDAARRAGLFNTSRARDLADSLRHARPGELENMLDTLADADLALKGSKRLPLSVLEGAVLRLCRS